MAYFEICVPNFNYERYLGATLDSVLSQRFADLRVLVSDNASTDDSVALVRAYQQRDSRIHLRINRCNVGFAGNLAKAAAMADGTYMLMLSSDDLMNDDALQTYQLLFDHLGALSQQCVVSSATTIVDSEGRETGEQRIDWKQWKGATHERALSELLDAPVYSLDAKTLLHNSLLTLRVPFYFLSTAYPKSLHDAVESYSQGGLFNPDKRFAWALLGHAQRAYFVDKPLFRYRVHTANQAALQAGTGALRHLVDEYVSTFSLDNSLLVSADVSRPQVISAFIEHDIALRGFKVLADGNRQLVRRMLAFGDACYPEQMAKNRKISALRLALMTGVAGSTAARFALGPATKLWTRQLSRHQQPTGKKS